MGRPARPIVGDQGQRCVVERSLESAPTAIDRIAAVDRRPLGGQGRPQADGHDRLLWDASFRWRTWRRRAAHSTSPEGEINPKTPLNEGAGPRRRCGCRRMPPRRAPKRRAASCLRCRRRAWRLSGSRPGRPPKPLARKPARTPTLLRSPAPAHSKRLRTARSLPAPPHLPPFRRPSPPSPQQSTRAALR